MSIHIVTLSVHSLTPISYIFAMFAHTFTLFYIFRYSPYFLSYIHHVLSYIDHVISCIHHVGVCERLSTQGLYDQSCPQSVKSQLHHRTYWCISGREPARGMTPTQYVLMHLSRCSAPSLIGCYKLIQTFIFVHHKTMVVLKCFWRRYFCPTARLNGMMYGNEMSTCDLY